MKTFKDWNISYKINSITIITGVVLILFTYLILIPQIRTNVMSEKEHQLKFLVEQAFNTAKSYYEKAAKGELTMEEAQALAKENVRYLRYEGGNYIWVHSTDNQMLVHAARPDLENTDASNLKDVNNKLFMIEITNACKARGEGYIEYYWAKPGETEPQPKLSYGLLFKEWNWIFATGIYIDDVDKTVSASANLILTAILIVIGLTLLIGYFISTLIVKPINTARNIAEKISNGDVNIHIENKSHDEIGELLDAFKKVQGTLQNIIEDAKVFYDAQKAGDLDYFIQSNKFQGAYLDVVSYINNTNKMHIENIMKILNMLKEYSEGNFEEEMEKLPGKQIIATNIMNDLRRNLILLSDELSIVIKGSADGDISVRMDANKFKGTYKELANGINKTVELFAEPIEMIAESVVVVASSTHQISTSSEEMSAGASELSMQTSEVASAVEEMTRTIIDTSKNTALAADASKIAGVKAKNGGKTVNEAVNGMVTISSVVEQSAQKIFKLGQNSEKIGEIVQVIDEIADQTNLLALNAAIEAARAGEQGRGFAVVADEVRKLAERTTKATKEIAEMIKQIQTDTSEAVESMQKGTENVEKGKKLVNDAGITLGEIIGESEKVTDLIVQVAAASEEQSATSEQISRSIESINNVAQESASNIHQIARAAEDLSKLATDLENIIARFKIESVSQKGKLNQSGGKRKMLN